VFFKPDKNEKHCDTVDYVFLNVDIFLRFNSVKPE